MRSFQGSLGALQAGELSPAQIPPAPAGHGSEGEGQGAPGARPSGAVLPGGGCARGVRRVRFPRGGSGGAKNGQGARFVGTSPRNV